LSPMKPIRLDEQLIDQFLTGQKDESESAFETLVKRHGPMVLGLCRRILHQDQDAEDAFQGTFLVLARKAGTIRDRRMLGYWLREVARRIAFRARECRARFRTEHMIPDGKELLPGTVSEASRDELRLHIHAAVDGLPAKYRLLVLHTYMEGNSNAQVARLLRCPVGTVKGRLSRARDLLRARLCRRGWDQDDFRYWWG
jgi:RNA polymerase sigma factor (sigma-70 family)